MDPSVVDQVTAVLVEPLTVAVYCWVPPEEIVELAGEMEIETVGALTVTEAAAEALVLA